MKISLLASVVLLAALVVAPTAQAKKRSRLKLKSTANTTQSSTPWVLLQGGTGTMIASGASKISFNLGATARVKTNVPLYVGMELGLNALGEAPAGESGSVGFQILPTAIYRFETASNQVIYPFVGISTGLHLIRGTAYYELLARPGMEVSLGGLMSLSVEGKFGVVDAEFAFFPSANAVFKL